MRKAVRARVPAAVAVVVTVAAGLTVRAVAGGWFGEYAGDALYTVLVYCLVVLVRPDVSPGLAAVMALGVSWLVEFAQLTPIPAALSQWSPLAGLVFGSTFNPPDLLAYLVGACVGLCAHRVLARRFCRVP